MNAADELGESPSDPVCAACRYSLCGVPDDRCPECGLTALEAGQVAARRQGLRYLLYAPLLILLIPVLWMGCLGAWFLQPDVGLKFGYYGRLNRAREVVRNTEGVQVLGEWVNHDITLEEVTFELLVDGRYVVRIFIPQEVSLERATHVILRRVDVANTLEPIERPVSGIRCAFEWNGGLVLSLGQQGDLAALTPSRADDAGSMLTHLGELLEYLRTTPLETLTARHRTQTPPPNAVWVEITDAP